MDIDMFVKILSAGVIASFVTGIFSLAISLKNNRRIIAVEKMKQKHDINTKRYEILNNYLQKLYEGCKSFEYNGEITYENTPKIYSSFLDKFVFLTEEHKLNDFLFEDEENIYVKQQINEINDKIDSFTDRLRNLKDEEDITDDFNGITKGIDIFTDSYLDIVKRKMNLILNEK